MRLLENKKYQQILDRLLLDFPMWEKLNGKTIFISGASGMIGSLLVDVIMVRNMRSSKESRCHIIASGRNEAVAKKRFYKWYDQEEFSFLPHDISNPLRLSYTPDFLIHAASTTHPLAYSQEPINTILANIMGTHNLLELAAENTQSRFLLLSSVEIYGENRGDTEYFAEDYCGYINCNTLRAGYPEAKRTSETLCQAYITQRNVDACTIRLPRIYGPTMRMSDTKAIAQFIKKGLSKEDIILKSKGNQLYSYAHTADAVQGILWVLLCGEVGQAYNLGDHRSDITLYELAQTVAQYTQTKVVSELPDEIEGRGYSTATKALLNAEKLSKLGWKSRYDIKTGICETIDILQDVFQKGDMT
ncbi:NAD-dependent epimerase/dehydratase family protein [Harryflintia acetispora]|uniref:Nucleoside-diphosphate-sugar epimerase n=1 Tax=Harryflintia acetispora TaxID=1849041 RepID=A0A9X8UHX3_9FIRM|nr:NAD-dependent epimerase/dehydratase family protein [Harryflintia acetispora]TCL42564.1 nucleoside-diphosphate-sugar epimerase [Harryflintia acetispora]